MDKETDNILRYFKGKLQEHFGGRVERVLLFGSRARGDSRSDSDIDVLIVLDKVREEDRDWSADMTGDIIDRYGKYLSVHHYSSEEYHRLNNPPSPFMQILSREAVPVW